MVLDLGFKIEELEEKCPEEYFKLKFFVDENDLEFDKLVSFSFLVTRSLLLKNKKILKYEKYYFPELDVIKIFKCFDLKPQDYMKIWVDIIHSIQFKLKPSDLKDKIPIEPDILEFLQTVEIELTPEQIEAMRINEKFLSHLKDFSDLKIEEIYDTCSFNGYLYRCIRGDIDPKLILSKQPQWYSPNIESTLGYCDKNFNIFVFKNKKPKIENLILKNNFIPSPTIITRKLFTKTEVTEFFQKINPEYKFHYHYDSRDILALALSDKEFSGWYNHTDSDQILLLNPQEELEYVGHFNFDFSTEWISDILKVEWLNLNYLTENKEKIEEEQNIIDSSILSLRSGGEPIKNFIGMNYYEIVYFIFSKYLNFYDPDNIKKRKDYPLLEDYFQLIDKNVTLHQIKKLKKLKKFFKSGKNKTGDIIYVKKEKIFILLGENNNKIVLPISNKKLEFEEKDFEIYFADTDDFNTVFNLLFEDFKVPFTLDPNIHLDFKEYGNISSKMTYQDVTVLNAISYLNKENQFVTITINQTENFENLNKINSFIREFDPLNLYFAKIDDLKQINLENIPLNLYDPGACGYEYDSENTVEFSSKEKIMLDRKGLRNRFFFIILELMKYVFILSSFDHNLKFVEVGDVKEIKLLVTEFNFLPLIKLPNFLEEKLEVFKSKMTEIVLSNLDIDQKNNILFDLTFLIKPPKISDIKLDLNPIETFSPLYLFEKSLETLFKFADLDDNLLVQDLYQEFLDFIKDNKEEIEDL